MDEMGSSAWAHAERIDNRCAEERLLGRPVLCSSCTHGQVMRRRGKLDLIVWCHNGMDAAKTVPPDLAECSEYEAKNAMSLHRMEQLAHPVDGRHGINEKSYL